MNIEDCSYYLRRLRDNPSRIVKIISSRNSRLILVNLFWEMKMEEFVRSTIHLTGREWSRFTKEIDESLLVSKLAKSYREVRKIPLGKEQMWHKMMYVILRKKRPTVVIETGVFDGISSAYILAALTRNRRGRLFSIDKPAIKEIIGSTDEMNIAHLPYGHKPGWIVPYNLRGRWQLFLGSSKEHLRKILGDVGAVDVFIHDSLHTYQNMMWEYQTVWPKIPKDGLLCSDDIFCNRAFADWCKILGKKVRQKGSFGVIKK